MTLDEPMLIESPRSGPFTKDGVTVEVCIYRMQETLWTLEVVDAADDTHVWVEEFETDEAAHSEFIRTVETEGMLVFHAAGRDRLN